MRARELLLDLGLTRFTGVMVARGAAAPDPGSFGPDRMDDLEGDVEGWVGKRVGVSGALVAVC